VSPKKVSKTGKPDAKKRKANKKVDWAKVAAKLPWGKDKETATKRKMLFRQFDPNGNGLLSLAEADLGVVGVLNMGDVVSKAVIMRAFQAAKGINDVSSHFACFLSIALIG
jgi:hypothetical protein